MSTRPRGLLRGPIPRALELPVIDRALVELVCQNPVVTLRAIKKRLAINRITALLRLMRTEKQEVVSEDEEEALERPPYLARDKTNPVAGDACG